MYFKTVITAIGIACSSLTAAAQKGLYLGVEVNPGFMVQRGYANEGSQLNGFTSFGANLSWYFSDTWGLSTGAVFGKYKYDHTSDLALMGVQDLSYVQVPLGLVFTGNGSQPVNAYFNFGVMTYFLTDAHLTGMQTYNTPLGTEQYSTADLNKFNIGTYAGAGAAIRLGRNFSGQAGIQFATGFLDTKKNGISFGGSDVPDRPMTFTLHLGLQMRLVAVRSPKAIEE